jgi:hypothetical protein
MLTNWWLYMRQASVAYPSALSEFDVDMAAVGAILFAAGVISIL